MTLELPSLTLCTVVYGNPVPWARALTISGRNCNFADVILFSAQPADGPFRNVLIPPFKSFSEYQRFMVKELVHHVSTSHSLIAGWDGYVVDPFAWSEEFLQYDYLSSRWDGQIDTLRQGQSRFSIRSKRLMEIMADEDFKILPNVADDDLITWVNRQQLENDRKIRFAPPELSDRFSYDLSPPQAPTFGFLGIGNFWRHVPHGELDELLDGLSPEVYRDPSCAGLAAAYFLYNRWAPFRSFYTRWLKHVSLNESRRLMARHIPPDMLPDFLRATPST